MKLRNLLLTAALFVSSAVAFAGSKDYEDYSWNNSEKLSTVNVTLQKFGTQGGFSYAVYDIDALNRITAEVNADTSIKKNQKEKEINKRMESYIWELKDPGENDTSVTTIALKNGTYVANFGVIGKGVYSVPNVSNQFHFYTTEETPANVVYFGKSSDSGHGNDKSARISFGAPLPAPVVTLLIALGFGAALVMYRNRKVNA